MTGDELQTILETNPAMLCDEDELQTILMKIQTDSEIDDSPVDIENVDRIVHVALNKRIKSHRSIVKLTNKRIK